MAGGEEREHRTSNPEPGTGTVNTNPELGTGNQEPSAPPHYSPYSPDRRTAVVFCGTGAHGAYHAGVLRALQEAGVKIDVVAGQGIGTGTAALAAIDGGARLWDLTGIWRSGPAKRFYRWKPLVAAVGWIATGLVVVLLVPLLVLLLAMAALALGFLLTLVGITSAGAALTTLAATALQSAFAGEHLPTTVPRLAMAVVALLVVVACAGVLIAQWRAPVRRRAEGAWWWRLIGAPLDGEQIRAAFATNIWQLIRGASTELHPTSATVGRRYAEVLAENLGQPGFRELIVVATDLDVRRDVVAALLREPHRREFFAPRRDRDRRAEVLDLAGLGRDHAIDIVAGAVTPPLVCDPAYVTFASDSFWRGETHRLCDRPASVHRLLEEVAAAGVTQVILASAVAPYASPHALRPPRLDIRNRLGEFLSAAESTAMRDAIESAQMRFDCVFSICPAHNPIGPFDFGGSYDEMSDRRQDLAEMMERAYEDAYRQFIEPVVGASGEQFAEVGALPQNAHTDADDIAP